MHKKKKRKTKAIILIKCESIERKKKEREKYLKEKERETNSQRHSRTLNQTESNLIIWGWWKRMQQTVWCPIRWFDCVMLVEEEKNQTNFKTIHFTCSANKSPYFFLFCSRIIKTQKQRSKKGFGFHSKAKRPDLFSNANWNLREIRLMAFLQFSTSKLIHENSLLLLVTA